jgi:3-phytase
MSAASRLTLALAGQLLVFSTIPAARTICAQTEPPAPRVRFATFNVSLYGKHAGDMARQLRGGNHPRARRLAQIVQQVRPDVLLLNEVDDDPEQQLLNTFADEYLATPQSIETTTAGPAAIEFPYRYAAPSNTGRHSGRDLDRNGVIDMRPGSRDYGGDCWGYGQYPGQYAFAVLSRYPIATSQIRTFAGLRWRDMPGGLLPDDPLSAAKDDWYTRETLAHFPLSSKNHCDVPIQVGQRVVHVLASHPTPPVFDGREDRNGRRNHDEIRLWIDYLGPLETRAQSSQGRAATSGEAYLRDDQGQSGGLAAQASFVVMGDLNADPADGEGQRAIGRLLDHPRVQSAMAPSSAGGREHAGLQGGVNAQHRGDPSLDTLDANDRGGPGNLRVDYVLPSTDLKLLASGVFWPVRADPQFALVGDSPAISSDHRLVWIDVAMGP